MHRLNGIYLNNWKKAGIEVVMGVGSFASAREVVVNLNDGGVRKFTAPHICIAVGGVPSPLGIPGEEHTINSDQFFALEKQPKKAAILGAGYVFQESGTSAVACSRAVPGTLPLRWLESLPDSAPKRPFCAVETPSCDVGSIRSSLTF